MVAPGRLVGQLDRAGQRRAQLAVGKVGPQRHGVPAAGLAGADRHQAEEADDRGGRVEGVAARIGLGRQRHAVDDADHVDGAVGLAIEPLAEDGHRDERAGGPGR